MEPFSDYDVDKIVNTSIKLANAVSDVLGKSQLRQRLDEIAGQLVHNRFWQNKPTSTMVLKRLRAIECKMGALLELLPDIDEPSANLDHLNIDVRSCLTAQAQLYGKGIGGYKDMPPQSWSMGATFVDYRGTEKLDSVISGVKLLHEWCLGARQRQERRAKAQGRPTQRGGARHKGDKAMQQFINDLADLWSDTVEELPGCSIPAGGGEPRGPFVLFVKAVRDILLKKFTPEDKIELPNLYEDLRDLTTDAIRGRFKKTPGARLKALIS